MKYWDKKITALEKEIELLRKSNFILESRVLKLEQYFDDPQPAPSRRRAQKERLNCWEFKKCGRQPGGEYVSELGICPAAQVTKHSGVNGGKNGGRVCWALVGTLCGGKIQGRYAEKVDTCVDCSFYNYVCRQEKQNFRYSLPKK